MPKKKIRSFRRRSSVRSYRKLFVIAVEGAKTEPQYFDILKNFDILNKLESVIQVKCLQGGLGSSPPKVLKRMRNYLKKQRLKKTDEAWLVVDKDQWSDAQLEELHSWSQTAGNYKLALSNPKFEYWLLLHFEDGTGLGSSGECSRRLKKYISDYNKEITDRTITQEMVQQAICRAKKRDTPRCEKWPCSMGGTTVYRLVENILTASAAFRDRKNECL